MLNVIYAQCHSQALCAECRYAECRSAPIFVRPCNLLDIINLGVIFWVRN
jgi:hypothetical protein